MEDLDDIRPGFGENGKKNPFIVPEDYFESFSESLHKRMNALKEPAGNIAGRKILRPALAYITGFCLLVVVGISIALLFIAPNPSQSKSETNLANLVQYSIENIDEQTIIEAIANTDMNPVTPEITKEELVKYLEEQNIDLNNINEEL
jgi:hypothetical protein